MSFYMSCPFFHIKFWLLYKLRKRKKNDIYPVVTNETLNKTLEISFKKNTKNERNHFYSNFTRQSLKFYMIISRI